MKTLRTALTLAGAGCLAVVVAAPAALAQDKPPSAQPSRVEMDQLDENPQQYLGKSIVVEAEVQEVLGPRLLTIDEYEWFDFDGDTLVLIRAPLAGLVREDARVMITGTLRPFVRAEIEREWGWFDTEPSIEVEFKDRPVLVATSIVSDQGEELAMAIEMVGQTASKTSAAEKGATGTTGAARAGAAAGSITSLSTLATAMGDDLVGRHVKLSGAQVAQMADKDGFWISAGQGQERLLVVPADPKAAQVSAGQTVSIDGVVLQMPDAMEDRIDKQAKGANDSIYVFASTVQPSR